MCIKYGTFTVTLAGGVSSHLASRAGSDRPSTAPTELYRKANGGLGAVVVYKARASSRALYVQEPSQGG